MQIPPVKRTENQPSPAAGTRSGVGSKSTGRPEAQPEPKPITAALQEEATQREARRTLTPSVKVTILTTPEDIAKFEAAAQAFTAVRAVPKDEAAQAKAEKAAGGGGGSASLVAAQTLGHEAVTSAALAQNANSGLHNVSPETAAKAAKLLAAGKEPGPNQPLTTEKAPSTDWTTAPKAVEKKPENPPPEPMSKKLLDFLQVLWQAGGNAIGVVQTANQTLHPDKLAKGPLTYEDPSTSKKTTTI